MAQHQVHTSHTATPTSMRQCAFVPQPWATLLESSSAAMPAVAFQQQHQVHTAQSHNSRRTTLITTTSANEPWLTQMGVVKALNKRARQAWWRGWHLKPPSSSSCMCWNISAVGTLQDGAVPDGVQATGTHCSSVAHAAHTHVLARSNRNNRQAVLTPGTGTTWACCSLFSTLAALCGFGSECDTKRTQALARWSLFISCFLQRLLIVWHTLVTTTADGRGGATLFHHRAASCFSTPSTSHCTAMTLSK